MVGKVNDTDDNRALFSIENQGTKHVFVDVVNNIFSVVVWFVAQRGIFIRMRNSESS